MRLSCITGVTSWMPHFWVEVAEAGSHLIVKELIGRVGLEPTRYFRSRRF
jgi:hypothetical protein